MEKDLKALNDASASKEDMSRVRNEVKKLYDGLHVGVYQVPSPNFFLINSNLRIFGSAYTCLGHPCVIISNLLDKPPNPHDFIEQDLHKLSKKESTEVRI